MIEKINWIVINWKKLWRTIGFPTANIKYSWDKIKPWVYKTNTIINWKIYKSASNYKTDTWLIETYIFNFDSDIYWKEIEIIFFQKIRENKKFDSLQDLKENIKKDIENIKSIENIVLTFWTFDLVHDWHKYFLNNSKKYWDKLITILATDKNVEKIKWFKTLNKETKRKKEIEDLNISNEVLIWNEENHFQWLDIYKPYTICLWYDQRWYADKLESVLKEKKLETKIIRIQPYKESELKSSILKKKLQD